MATEQPYFFSLDNAIDRLMMRESFFVQIGANDGVTVDPIHQHIKSKNMDGLLVEPLPEMMSALQNNYRGKSGLQFAQCAVTETNGPVTMKTFDDSYAEQITGGTLVAQISDSPTRSDRAISNIRCGGDKHVVERVVTGKTLETLLREQQVRHIDLLQIDVEGYDWRVLKQLDFAKFRPKVIHMEFAHLPRHEQEEARTMLREQGYVFALHNGRDMLAVAGEHFDKLLDEKQLKHFEHYLEKGVVKNKQDLMYAVALMHQAVGCLTSSVSTGSAVASAEGSFKASMRDTGGVRDPSWHDFVDAMERMQPLFTNKQDMCDFLQAEMPRMQLTTRNLFSYTN